MALKEQLVISSAALLLAVVSGITSKCLTHDFACANGECVGGEYVCDGLNHCTDGSDESYCRNYTEDATQPTVSGELNDSEPTAQVKFNKEHTEEFSALATYLLPPNPPSDTEEIEIPRRK